MHILDGMGRGQEWISCIEPRYLVEKYCAKNETQTTMVDYSEDGQLKPVQTKWKPGFVHGDPFEERVVVLD